MQSLQSHPKTYQTPTTEARRHGEKPIYETQRVARIHPDPDKRWILLLGKSTPYPFPQLFEAIWILVPGCGLGFQRFVFSASPCPRNRVSASSVLEVFGWRLV